jgi:hypothetical protein
MAKDTTIIMSSVLDIYMDAHRARHNQQVILRLNARQVISYMAKYIPHYILFFQSIFQKYTSCLVVIKETVAHQNTQYDNKNNILLSRQQS